MEYTPGFLQLGVPLQLAQQGVKKEFRRKRKSLEVTYILQTSFCQSQTGFFSPKVLVRDFGTNVHCELGCWGCWGITAYLTKEAQAWNILLREFLTL